MGESPFLVNGTIKEHLKTSKQRYPESAAHIKEIEESLYVDDLITSDATIEEVQKVKETAIRVFEDVKFKLHKWHSNVKELDDFTTKPDISFEKKELRTETSGVLWNKVKDIFGVNFQVPDQPTTKRGVLNFFCINSSYHFTRHATCKGHVQRRMRPEAVFGPKATERPQETMGKMDIGFTTPAN